MLLNPAVPAGVSFTQLCTTQETNLRAPPTEAGRDFQYLIAGSQVKSTAGSCDWLGTSALPANSS